MIILSITCDNLFMFKNFFIDFTYARKLSHPLAKDDELFPGSGINVRKKMIILGANASGKTTFGQLLCGISNYIIGRDTIPDKQKLQNAVYDHQKDSSFEIEFVIEDMAYHLKAIFDHQDIKFESLAKAKISKSYNIKKLREVLTKTDYKFEYRKKDSEVSDNRRPFVSQILKDVKNEAELAYLSQNVWFHYIFSHFAERSINSKINLPVELINGILPQIDNSVEKVVRLAPADETLTTKSYLIVFKNGDQITIPEGDLLAADRDRLSHGTYEALTFLNVIEEIKRRENFTIFVDEKLAHLHVELEAYLVMKAFWGSRNTQVFFTSHNSELLDLNVPNTAFVLFKRDADGYNKTIYISDKVNKNDRRIRCLYENDVFGVLPDYTALDGYFEDNDNE